jgi:hypothetical protein
VRTCVLVPVALLAGACTAGGSDNNVAAERNLASIMNNLPPAPCPEEELSCGKQRPVVSDGTTRFVNDNMSLSGVFPAGSQVCLTRSGDEPRGFFAIYGAPPSCAERPERPPRFIVLSAMFNAAFYVRAEEILGGDCRPLSAETQRRLGAPLAMPGFRTLLCETRSTGGSIEISMNFLGGPWWEGETPGSRRRKVVYVFILNTTPDHFDEDLARFRRVLASVRIATRD